MASPGNQHCANCIGTLSFPICSHDRRPWVHTTCSESTMPFLNSIWHAGGIAAARRCLTVSISNFLLLEIITL